MNTTLFPGEQDNEHFVNWMYLAAFTDFRKLWGIIDDPLQSDNYTIFIENNFPHIDGEKSIILSNTSWIGGKNSFFSNYLFVISGFSLASMSLVFVYYVFNRFPLYTAVTQPDDEIETALTRSLI